MAVALVAVVHRRLQDTGWGVALHADRVRFAVEIDADVLLPRQSLATVVVDISTPRAVEPRPMEELVMRIGKLLPRHQHVHVFVAMTSPTTWTAAGAAQDVADPWDALETFARLQDGLLAALLDVPLLPVHSAGEWSSTLHELARVLDPNTKLALSKRLILASRARADALFLSDCERVTGSIVVDGHALAGHDCLVLQELGTMRAIVAATPHELQECALDRRTCEEIARFFDEDRAV